MIHSLANVAEYSAGATFGPRKTTSFEFVWVLRGSATWHFASPSQRVPEKHLLTPGVIGLSVLGATERYDWDPAQSSSHGFVHFDLPAGVDPSAWPRTRRTVDYPLLAALAASLLSQSEGDEHMTRQRSAQTIGMMLEVFLSAPAVGFPTSDEVPAAIAQRAVKQVRDTWAATGMRIIDISELARALEVSAGYLSRSFRARFGVGPARAFELVRLARVAVALQRTSSTVASIAAEYGFSDEFHLSKRFSRIYAVPPGAYRREHRTDEPLAPLFEQHLVPLWNSLAYWI